ncbi:MAG: ECF transporter S component [Candidatus Izemoplasmatales bacterium]
MRKRTDIKKLSVIGILSALAFVLMLLSFTVAGPYKLDFAELPVMIGAFAYGPVVGVTIETIKIVLDIILGGPSNTAYVGELANLLMGISFVVPASLIYFHKKTKKQAIIGLVCGTISMIVVAAILNIYVLLPLYAELYVGSSLPALLKIYGFDSMFKFIILVNIPFNILKGVANSILVMLIYKRISPVIKAKDCDEVEKVI